MIEGETGVFKYLRESVHYSRGAILRMHQEDSTVPWHVSRKITSHKLRLYKSKKETQLLTFFLLHFIIHSIVTIEYTLN